MLSMQVPLQFGLVWVTFDISGNNPYDVISSSNFFESYVARVSRSKLKSPIKYRYASGIESIQLRTAYPHHWVNYSV